MIGKSSFAALGLIALVACAEEPGEITRDTEPFAGIAEAADIYVGGTEPFWGLNIEPEGEGYQARYSTPEQPDGSEFPVTRFAGNNGVSFSGELDEQVVQVLLTPGECSDGMSDRIYPYTATVELGDTKLYGCAHTSDEPFSGEETP